MKTLSKSNIGYRGIGADGQPVDWHYGWNPCGFGCSRGCDGCWARRMAGRSQCPQCREFVPHFHRERLEQPFDTKRPGVVLVQFTGEVADKSAPGSVIFDVLRAARCAPQHVYVWLTRLPVNFVLACCEAPAGVNAIPQNWYIGQTARNQAEFDRAIGICGQATFNCWLSLEPLQGPIHFDSLPDSVQGIIVGHDNRRGALGTHTLLDVNDVVADCQHAMVSCYVKQVWVDDSLIRVPKFLPEFLRPRNLPWSMPKEKNQ